jgi:DNA-binding CsgD family transcriptional regulator
VTTRIAPPAAPEAAISELLGDGGQVVDAERLTRSVGWGSAGVAEGRRGGGDRLPGAGPGTSGRRRGLVLGEFRRLATMPRTGRADAATPRLTERETEVLRLVAKGLSYPQVAQRLQLSHRTVQNHVQNTLGKLHLHNRGSWSGTRSSRAWKSAGGRLRAGYPGPVHAADSHDLIRVHGARENNLKNVSVEIPKRRLGLAWRQPLTEPRSRPWVTISGCRSARHRAA